MDKDMQKLTLGMVIAGAVLFLVGLLVGMIKTSDFGINVAIGSYNGCTDLGCCEYDEEDEQ